VIYFASYIVTHVDYELLRSSVDRIKEVVEKQQRLAESQARRSYRRGQGRAR